MQRRESAPGTDEPARSANGVLPTIGHATVREVASASLLRERGHAG